MTILVNMLREKVPLHTWRSYVPVPGRSSDQYRYLAHNQDAQYNTWADTVVAALSHPEVVALVAKEYDALPTGLRTRLTQRCNEERNQPRSNNAVKGINALNTRLCGRLLADQQHVRYVRELREVDGQMRSINRRVTESAAAAEAAFASRVTPADYGSWSPSKKREWQQQVAAERRQNARR